MERHLAKDAVLAFVWYTLLSAGEIY